MTLPSLIQKNNNKVVETRLKKFYSSINQAILMAEADYGDKKIWYEDLKGAEFDKDGNPIPGSSPAEKWFNKYLKPYLKVIKTETTSYGALIIYFEDGSALRPNHNWTRDWFFYPGNQKKCEDKKIQLGVCRFAFNFYPAVNDESWKYHYNKGFEPYKYEWNGKIESLYNGTGWSCNTTNDNGLYCTAIIQMNGWKIPDDYPYKVSY